MKGRKLYGNPISFIPRFPGDGHPLSLTNLQVTIGDQNVLQSVLNYNYDFFRKLEFCV